MARDPIVKRLSCAACPLLRAGLAAFALGPVFIPFPALTQVLAQLHVRTFTLSSDRYTPHVGEQLHLTIVVHVDERIGQLDNVTLPDLSGFDVYGDERRCARARRGGTDCTEVVLIAPKETGDRTIDPVTLDAVDARNHRPSRFASNRVTLHVTGEPFSATDAARQVSHVALDTLVVLGAAAIPFVLGLLLLRATRRRPASPPPVAAPPAPSPLVRPVDPLLRLVVSLRDEPGRARVLAVRDELRRRVGARDEETLGDLEARDAARNKPALGDALRAIEYAAFVEEARLVDAVREALPALERLVAAADPVGAAP